MNTSCAYLMDAPHLDLADMKSAVAAFLQELVELGVHPQLHVDGTPSTEWPLIALLTGHVDTEELLRRSKGYREIVPVSFLAGPSTAFADLSQIVVSEVGMRAAAEKAALIVRYGGRNLVEWNRLAHSARAWRADASTQPLLSASQLPPAFALLQSDRAKDIPEHRDYVRTYVEASSSAVTRRRRRGMTIVTISATVLLAFVVAAAIQSSAAISAEQKSVTEADRSTATRLSSVAREYVSRDPDLPSILVNRAVGLSRDPAVLAAAADVAASTLEHRSLELAAVPRQVSAARNRNLLAVSSMLDSSVMLVDTSRAEITARLDYGDGGQFRPASIELSPDGTWLAVHQNDAAPRLMAADASGPPAVSKAVFEPADEVFGWQTGSELILSRGGHLQALDVTTGQRRELMDLSPDESVRAVALSPNGAFLAVALSERVVLLRAETREQVRSLAIVGITDLAVNNAGNALYGARHPFGVAVTIGKTPDSDEIVDSTVPAASVEPLDGSYFAVGDRSGEISIQAGDRQEPALSLRAHLTDVVRLARLGNGDLASVGYDRYLRLWRVPEAERFGQPTDIGYRPMNPAGTAQGGHQIRYLDNNAVGVVIAPSYGRILMGDERQSSSQFTFGGLLVRSVLTPDARHQLLISSDRLQVYGFDKASTKWGMAPVLDISASVAGLGVNGLEIEQAAVSPSGSSVLLANASAARVWEAGQTSPSRNIAFSSASPPIAARLGDDMSGAIVTADGILRALDGSEMRLELADGAPASTVLGAVFADDQAVVFVNDAGALLEQHGDVSRQLLPAGSAPGSFSLRLSPDSNYIAVLSKTKMLVVHRASGRVAFAGPSLGGMYVADAAFSPADPGRIETVSSLGTVGSVRFDTAATVDLSAGPPVVAEPRVATKTEEDTFALSGVDNGG